MKYDNLSIRRRDRLLPESDALTLLRTAEYGVLSMVAETGGGYGIPVNFVWNGETSIYIHCAPKGRKLRCIEQCDGVSFCVIGRTNPIPDQFTTEYESIVLCGTAHIGLTPEERTKALELLIDKYATEYQELGNKYIEKSFHRTEIIRIDIDVWSGKCKRIEI